jgi:hypothetical protein
MAGVNFFSSRCSVRHRPPLVHWWPPPFLIMPVIIFYPFIFHNFNFAPCDEKVHLKGRARAPARLAPIVSLFSGRERQDGINEN